MGALITKQRRRGSSKVLRHPPSPSSPDAAAHSASSSAAGSPAVAAVAPAAGAAQKTATFVQLIPGAVVIDEVVMPPAIYVTCSPSPSIQSIVSHVDDGSETVEPLQSPSSGTATNSSSSRLRSSSSEATTATWSLNSPVASWGSLNASSPRGNAVMNARKVSLASGGRAHNSTLNLFVDTTLENVQLMPLLSCIASYLLSWMDAASDAEGAGALPEAMEVFEDPDRDVINDVPTHVEVTDYLTSLFSSFEMPAGPALVMVVFIDRLCKGAQVPFRPSTWRRVVLAAFVLTAKVIEDLAVFTSDVLDIPGLPLHGDGREDINELERACLFLLDFDVNVRANAYASAYFDLRNHAIQRDLEFHEYDDQIGETARIVDETVSRRAQEVRLLCADRVGSAALNDLRKSVSELIPRKTSDPYEDMPALPTPRMRVSSNGTPW